MANIDELRWVRIFDPYHIPRYLLEQIKDKDYDIDAYYKMHADNCVIETENGKDLNPYSYLYVLADPSNKVKGFLWLGVDSLTHNCIIHTYSVDKEYWNKGEAVKKLADFVKGIRKAQGWRDVLWVTKYPKHSERNGFKRSKHILMEYSGE